jgi:mxaJ protein
LLFTSGLAIALAGGICFAGANAAVRASALRVCADPNNLPFSNDRQQGFENRIAALLARDLDATLRYTWWAQRRGFLRNTLNAGVCDLVVGVPSAIEGAAVTRPYYRSSYVFVSRTDRHLDIRSIDDERLRRLRIGVPLVGDDGGGPPPALALSRRGVVRNVVGFNVFGDYAHENAPSRLIAAVASRDVDVAIAWGPLAGYYAARQPVPIDVAPMPQAPNAMPFAFDISMAVRRGDTALRSRADAFLVRRAAAIARILDEFHVPRARRGGAS